MDKENLIITPVKENVVEMCPVCLSVRNRLKDMAKYAMYFIAIMFGAYLGCLFGIWQKL